MAGPQLPSLCRAITPGMGSDRSGVIMPRPAILDCPAKRNRCTSGAATVFLGSGVVEQPNHHHPDKNYKAGKPNHMRHLTPMLFARRDLE